MSGKRGTNKRSLRAAQMREHAVRRDQDETYTFKAEYDEDGVWFYQAYKEGIADWAVEHGTLGGPLFNPSRMTWIKPSFAWMLYRCGYGLKHDQERVLKLKLPHRVVAELLEGCACTHGGGGTKGRVQWDPARDLYSSEDREPRKMLRERDIQIGLSKDLSERFAQSIVAVVDVSALARRVGEAHRAKDVRGAMEAMRSELPNEQPYMPRCKPHELVRLRLISEEEAASYMVGAEASSSSSGEVVVAAAAAGAATSGDAAAEHEAAQAEGGEEAAAEEVPFTKKQRSWGERSLENALPHMPEREGEREGAAKA